MSRFFTKCPFCQEVIKGDTEWIEQEVSCPYCQKEFILKSKKHTKYSLLINCKYCHNKIDIKDSICYFCGEKNIYYGHSAPLTKKEKIEIYIVNSVFIAIVLLILLGLGSCFYSCSKAVSKGNRNTSHWNDKHKAWVQAQYYVEAQLKNPGSAKFEYAGASKADVSGDIYIFRSYVDATNSFGGTIRTYFFCKLRKKYDDNFELIQLDFSQTPYGAYPTY